MGMDGPLYDARRTASIGDLADLQTLARWSADLGAGYVAGTRCRARRLTLNRARTSPAAAGSAIRCTYASSPRLRPESRVDGMPPPQAGR
jgi:hypothetical protein